MPGLRRRAILTRPYAFFPNPDDEGVGLDDSGEDHDAVSFEVE